MSLEAHVKDGRIVLDSPVELPDGAKLRIEIVDGSKGPTLYDKLASVAGRAQNLPPDASINHDHYLYGTPKQEP